MPDRSKTKTSCILLVAALLLPLWVQAQTDPLYKVELLVFSRPAGAAAEHWDATPELNYPTRSRFLIEPGEQRNIPAAPVAGTAQPTAFATLSSQQRGLSGKAAAMQRSGRYRILFHEAWIQPMSGKAQTLPIVLDRSGDGGQWPALQGSIKLYLSRYFYLDTNLWLNTQGEYLQQSEWRMPAPPLAPMSRAREQSVVSESTRASAAAPAQPVYRTSPGGAQPAAVDTETMGPQYPFRHAVLLDQTQRMRSGELAYIDHPLLGVLITVTPLDTAEG